MKMYSKVDYMQMIILSSLWNGVFKIVSLQCLVTKDFTCFKDNHSVSIPLCDELNLHVNASCVSIMQSKFTMDLEGSNIIYFIK